jgi:hypothetical protein
MQKDKKLYIVKRYANLNKINKRRPKMDELLCERVTKDTIKHHFSSLTNLDAEARDAYPDSFFDTKIESVITPKLKNDIKKSLSSRKRFVITTAVTGSELDTNFHASLKSYCRKNSAALLVLVASDPAHNMDRGSYGYIDSRLSKELIVVEDLVLNSNLFVSTIKLSAKHIDPTIGLDRIGHRDGSFIFASPKQRLQLIPTSNVKLPHALMTTGAVTKPNYKTSHYMSERTAYIADADHVMGAIIVEIVDDSTYHYRQVQAGVNGSFVDLGTRYNSDGSKQREKPAAVVLGDWHSGSTDPQVYAATIDILTALKPANLVLHDAFDGAAINHHEEFNLISKAIDAKNSAPSLQEELVKLKEDLETLSDYVSKIVIVKSNHDEFLSKHYLQKGKYVQDPQNHYFSLDLAKAMIEGKDPLQFALEVKLNLATSSKIKWLQRDEDFKVANVQLGAHGDKGPNGSRGSLKAMHKAYGDSVTGHSHTPGIWHGAWSVGTSSKLKLSYNQGPSSWMHTHCLVYEDGSRQLINIINSSWKL